MTSKRISFDKRLASYALAGAATLAAPAAAHASIIFTDVNPDETRTTAGGGGTYNPLADLVLSANDPNSLQRQQVTASGTGILTNGTNWALALTFGSVIDPSSGSWETSGKLVGNDALDGQNGLWSYFGGTNYLGFSFNPGDGLHAGWAEISTSLATDASFTVKSYAYESVANTAILAGAGAVPEPSSMALIALGGAGLLALRRRRSTNA